VLSGKKWRYRPRVGDRKPKAVTQKWLPQSMGAYD